eukprot:TRINITY_DN359_c0_g1_i8.p1 TRINITY_DN359_c0_g1~~TRINITY_DN359_c0_g1_i8.p1  ORF type:complete len:146 (+),score=27.72 TRINITY_DN359_c0_g1_i8:35-472(+)
MGSCVSASKESPRTNIPVTPLVTEEKIEQQIEIKQENSKQIKSNSELVSEDGDVVYSTPIENVYSLGKEIGRGGFSVVIEGTNKETGEKFAIKSIKKTMAEGDDIKLLRREIHIMKKVNHPNILKLFEVYEDDETFYLVMELYVF